MSVQSLETYVSERTHESPQGITHAGMRHAARRGNCRQNPGHENWCPQRREMRAIRSEMLPKRRTARDRAERDAGRHFSANVWDAGYTDRDAERVPKPQNAPGAIRAPFRPSRRA